MALHVLVRQRHDREGRAEVADLTDGGHGDGFSEPLDKLVPVRPGLFGQRRRERHVQPAGKYHITPAQSVEQSCEESACPLTVALASTWPPRPTPVGLQQLPLPTEQSR